MKDNYPGLAYFQHRQTHIEDQGFNFISTMHKNHPVIGFAGPKGYCPMLRRRKPFFSTITTLMDPPKTSTIHIAPGLYTRLDGDQSIIQWIGVKFEGKF